MARGHLRRGSRGDVRLPRLLVPAPRPIKVTYNGKTYNGSFVCTPDGVVQVYYATGSASEDLELSSDDGPRAQAERMLLEIVRKP